MRKKLSNMVLMLKRDVPSCNRRNYDIETAARIDEIIAAPERFDELTALLYRRITAYQRGDLSHTLPMLPRRPGESMAQLLDRESDAVGLRRI